MAVVVGQKEFSRERIAQQEAIAQDPKKSDAERRKAKAFALEMSAYNARALRGDFDTY